MPTVLTDFDRLVTPMRPSVVVLYAGDNDLDQATSPARLHFMHRIGYTNRIVERALQDEPDVSFFDITRRMVARGLIAWQRHYDSDPLHMNAKGYRVWGRSLREYLDATIGGGSAGTGRGR